jgi:hypothetical protein
MVTVEDRRRVRDRVLAIAQADGRVRGGAITGSGAAGTEDRWSDIDTAFGVADGVDPGGVLDEWTVVLDREFGVIHHWDLRRDPTIYRVFLLAGGLELDIAVTPASQFGARGPKFRLVFGQGPQQPGLAAVSPDDLIGMGWLALLTAGVGVARGRPWYAEHWLGAAREQAFALACLRLGEAPEFARGTDRLPRELTEPFKETLPASLEHAELGGAVARAGELFVAEVARHDAALAERLRGPLQSGCPPDGGAALL